MNLLDAKPGVSGPERDELMNHVLRPFLRKCVVVFLDDILVFSRTWKEHRDHLDAVLSALHDQSLFCNIVKCEFALEQCAILGSPCRWHPSST